MSPVLMHLPAGFPRTLRVNDAPLISHLGYRVWIALMEQYCAPTARAVAERFGVNKDTAARALRTLITSGLLWRERRSAGKGVFAWCYLLTDEPFAWLEDSALAEKIQQAHEREVDRLRALHQPDPVEAAVPVPTPPATPAPEQGSPQEDQLDSCPTSPDVPIKNSRREIFTPNPTPVGKVIHRPSRVERIERRLLALTQSDPGLEPHIPDALALLHGLGFPPMGRVVHCRVIADALQCGLPLNDITQYLTSNLSTARSPKAVIKYRLDVLRAELDRARRRNSPDARVLTTQPEAV